MSDVRRFDSLERVVRDSRRRLDDFQSTVMSRLASHTHPDSGGGGHVESLSPGAAQLNSSSFPQYRTFSPGSNIAVPALAFADNSVEIAFWPFLAQNYGGGAVTLDIDWFTETATTGDVRWSVSIGCITPNTDTVPVGSKTGGTAVAVVDSHLGTNAARLHRVSMTFSTAGQLNSMTSDDWAFLRFSRAGSDVTDTLVGDALVVGLTLRWS